MSRCRTATPCARTFGRRSTRRSKSPARTASCAPAWSASSPTCASRSSSCTARTPLRGRAQLLRGMARTATERSAELRELDHEREITPDWLHREHAVGYVTYVDRFAGTLQGVRERLPYLRELGITYLHLMPLLRARPAPNDGGYAVADYGAVEPALGTMDDLVASAADLRVGHGAVRRRRRQPHRARARLGAGRVGRRRAQAGLLSHLSLTGRSPTPTRRRLEIFPDIAPGSFTWVPESGRWAWTTFNSFQWVSTTRTPRSSARWRTSCWRWRPSASTSCGWTPSPSCGSARGPTARTSLRSTCSCRPSARRCGSPPRPSRSRPRRSPCRASSSPTSASVATRARR